MALSTHQERTLSDREYNSNYLKKRNLMAQPSSDRDALGNSVNDSGRLSKTASIKQLQTKKSASKVFLSYNNMFVEDTPAKTTRNSQNRSTTIQNYTPRSVNDKDDCFSLCFSEDSYDHTRLVGGANRTQQEVDKLILSPSQCKYPAVGLSYNEPKKQVNLVHLQLSDSHTMMKLECPNLPLRHVGKSKTRGTQTLYRISSAQTMPYLPGVINDEKELETLELFKLPTILPGNGPPGLYEVEVLERARKRWAFAKAIKENFRKQLQEAREQAKLRQNNHVLEAFEWEHWLEREEYIQECQMLRFEILIRMFDKREREMHTASRTRIQKSCEMIEAKKQAALKKNEIVHARALRRLEIKHAKQPRVWRKEHISQELGDPSSEFYAPKMRNGVNPNRRHFQASRKDFNMRMDDLEKTAVKMDYRHLKCPFAKVNAWSKPKEVAREVEQNFCSEANLKKLYESMRTLRESSIKQRTAPLCLEAKVDKTKEPKPKQLPEITIEEEKEEEEGEEDEEVTNTEEQVNLFAELRKQLEEAEYRKAMEELRKQKTEERQRAQMLQKEMRCEEMETLINSYEGNTIGWLMRFLSQEMCRVIEQRKLHFFTMVAKRERWHREAAEAGLRQKENKLRLEYEQIYQECDQANTEIAEKFLSDILDTDILDHAEEKAEADVTVLARKMDSEINRWLEAFREIQTPLNYDTIRYALLDICKPDKQKILYRKETDDCIQYIINDVIFANVYRLLETYDVSFSITTDFVDRLIDNDLHLNSPECSSECACECTGFCTCSLARNEAMAIIRKVIRRAVPGRRWRTSHERVAFENIRDLLDDVFDRAIPKGSIIEIDMQTSARVEDQAAHTDLVDLEHDVKYSDHSCKSRSDEGSMYKVRPLSTPPGIDEIDITKSLQYTESLLIADPDTLSSDGLLIHEDKYNVPLPTYQPQRIREIPSTYDISNTFGYKKALVYNQTSSDELLVEEEEETKYGSEHMDEIKSRTEEWALEVSSSHLGINEEYEEEGIEEEYAKQEQDEVHSNQNKINRKSIDSSVRFSANPVELIFIPKSTDEIADDKADDEADEEADDRDDDGVISVSFSYSPLHNYTIPIPSENAIFTENDSGDSNRVDITETEQK